MSRSARRAIFLVVNIVIVAAVALAGCGGGTSAEPARRTGWDPRLLPIATRVEKLRRLEFKHPVRATFLPNARFRKRVTADESKVSRKDRRALQVGEAELRSLGLVGGSFDLLKTTNKVSGSGVLAYYDPDEKEIVVRGTSLDPEAKVTLAHELTHALQDQHYNLNRLRDGAKTAGADDAIVALVEGDATRIETKFYFELSPRERRQVDKAEGSLSNGAKSPDAPKGSGAAGDGIVAASFDSPYAFGPSMVDMILAARHGPGLAAAFRHPPKTQLQMLVPTRAVKSAVLPKLRRPVPRAGAKRVAGNEPDDVGAVDLYFLLASRLPAALAIRAADSWGNGKELITRTKSGATCVDLTFAARDRAGADLIANALRLWAASMPADAITVSKNGLSIRGCDPGKAAKAPPNSAETALAFAATRNFLVADLVQSGAPAPVAACLGDRIVDRPEFAGVLASSAEQREPTEAEVAGVTNAIKALITDCS